MVYEDFKESRDILAVLGISHLNLIFLYDKHSVFYVKSSSSMLFQGSQSFTGGLYVRNHREVVCIMEADVEIGAPMCEEDPQLLLENDHFRCKCSDRNMQGN